MKRRDILKAATVSLVLPKLKAQVPTSGQMKAVLTRGGDNYRTGTQLNETILTQANVAQRGLKELFSPRLSLEGDARGAEAQLLVCPSVLVADGTTRDLLIAATMNGLVWAFDANSSDIIWVEKLAPPVKGNGSIDMFGINDHWSILSTPVIDPDTHTLYCVAWSSTDGIPQNAKHSFHALNLRDGSRVHPALSLANVTYQPPNGLPIQRFGVGMRKQRSALTLATISGCKTVFFGSGSVLETSKGASGWIVAYDVSTQALAGLALASRYYGAGLWMAGQGLCVGPDGYLYAVTGNGGFDGVTDFGECAIKVQYTPPFTQAKSTPGKLEIVDWWTPWSDAGRVGANPALPVPNELTLPEKVAGVSAPSEMPVNMMHEIDLKDATHSGPIFMLKPDINAGQFSDQDLGCSGCSLDPDDNTLVVSGKDGISYVINAQNMGKTMPADLVNPATNYAKLKSVPEWFTYYPGAAVSPTPQTSSDLDFLFNGKTHHMHSSAIRFKSSIYGKMYFCGGENGNVRAWSMDSNCKLNYLACGAEVASPNAPPLRGGMTGWMLTLSSNGSQPGTALLWALMPYGDANKTVGAGRLICYDPENFGTFSDGSKQLRVLWDSAVAGIPITFNKFNVLTISNGRVFIPTYNAQIATLVLQ